MQTGTRAIAPHWCSDVLVRTSTVRLIALHLILSQSLQTLAFHSLLAWGLQYDRALLPTRLPE
jgi:hypothetical protein